MQKCDVSGCDFIAAEGVTKCIMHRKDGMAALNAPVPDPSSQMDNQPLWKHKKGGLYRITGYCIIEKGCVPAVMYEQYQVAGPTWIRPCSEFFDGRFTQAI